jgi:hypothetical protein
MAQRADDPDHKYQIERDRVKDSDSEVLFILTAVPVDVTFETSQPDVPG